MHTKLLYLLTICTCNFFGKSLSAKKAAKKAARKMLIKLTQARETLEKYRLWGFKFNSINFGQAPPRLEGLKVRFNLTNESVIKYARKNLYVLHSN